MDKEKVIFTIQLVNFLAKKGIIYKNRKPNLKRPEFDVFYYDDTPELRQAMEEYTNRNQ